MKSTFLSLLLLALTGALSYAQVGIGTTNPNAFFNVAQGRTVLFGQDSSQVGSENKLIWYASQGAFRVGGVDDDSWSRSNATDNTNVGQYSFASGHNTRASGVNSFAIGEQSTASGRGATAMGYLTTASGFVSTAIGIATTASGFASTAMGYGTTASGDYSMAMGSLVSTNGHRASFIIGDQNGNEYLNSTDNQMMMRFGGGYMLYSSNTGTRQATAVGVQLSANGNAWQTLSDSTRKENFRSVDGAGFLRKISQMRLGSWNYKGQDVKQYRHYGPMAQEFFAAFGHDELGTIGEDKSINQADLDGVNLIAIQALIKKVEKLETENEALRTELTDAKRNQTATQTRLDQIEARLNDRSNSASISFKP